MSTPNLPAAALSDRITQLTQNISRHEAAIRRSAGITTSVGLIALAALCIYFYFGYTTIGGLLEPQTLVPYGARMLEERLPEAREALVKQITQSAPGWAKEVSAQARKEIPGLRGKLEGYVLSSTDELLGKVTTLTEEHLRKMIEDNRDLLEKGFKELANSDTLAEETLNALVVALEQELRADMRSQAETVLETLRYLSDRVQRLSEGRDLDEQERYMRQILMIARRMRDTTALDDPTSSSAPPSSELAIESPRKADSASENAGDSATKTDGKSGDGSK